MTANNWINQWSKRSALRSQSCNCWKVYGAPSSASRNQMRRWWRLFIYSLIAWVLRKTITVRIASSKLDKITWDKKIKLLVQHSWTRLSKSTKIYLVMIIPSFRNIIITHQSYIPMPMIKVLWLKWPLNSSNSLRRLTSQAHLMHHNHCLSWMVFCNLSQCSARQMMTTH